MIGAKVFQACIKAVNGKKLCTLHRLEISNVVKSKRELEVMLGVSDFS